MRLLGIGHNNDLGDLYMRVAARGHEVRVHIGDPESHDILAGLVTRTTDWRAELPWVGAAGHDGLLLFESTGFGEEQDRLRQAGHRVFGGSALGDRLELERSYGQRVLGELGLRTAETRSFHGFDEAIDFVTRTRRRYVLKFEGAGYSSTRTYVGVLDDGEDMVASLRLQRRRWAWAEQPRILLMAHLAGVEVGVGGLFNGREFLRPRNLDWEHKRFFPGDLGELTGEMGTVVTYRGADRLFDATLGRAAPLLAASGYVGYVNLNLIVNEEGAWPLEFTCRFGYPGFAILSALHREPWDALLARTVDAAEPARHDTHDGFAVGIVITVPPFPYPDGYERLSKGVPVLFRRDVSDVERASLHYGEVALDEGGQLVTAGQVGYVLVVTGRGATVGEARARAVALAAKVVVPNARYRTDIGVRLEDRDLADLTRLGWLD